MKKNSAATKQLLERALQQLGFDNATNTVRFHIKKALNEINKISVRDSRRLQETPLQQWKLNLEVGAMYNPNLSPVVMKNLEALIAQEQAKIDTIKSKKSSDQQSSNMIND